MQINLLQSASQRETKKNEPEAQNKDFKRMGETRGDHGGI